MSELEDVVAALNSARVRYLLIGGLASILYGVPRTTTDIDFALDPKKENVRRTVAALGRRKTIRYRNVRCPTVSRKDQIRLLRATGRKKDFEYADHLESLS